MSKRKESKQRLAAPLLSYTTRFHLKRRLASIDYRFAAAVIALIVATLVVIRYA
jgi:hypothetical protein